MEDPVPPHRSEVTFVSLGMVVLDELRFPGKEPLKDVVGGSGAYSLFGARAIAGSSRSASVGCIIKAGNDFPNDATNMFREWGIQMVMKRDPDKSSTRGLLEYEDTTFGPKKFRYTTPPLKPVPSDLFSTGLLASQVFHMLATPDEIEEQVPRLLELRKQCGIEDSPLIVWEPLPASCTPENLGSYKAAYRHVDVFSPNHLELTRLYTLKAPDVFQPSVLEGYAERFSDDPSRYLVVRAGEYGALFPSTAGGFQWLQPFYTPTNDSRVVDPTGAGNAFLGAFAIALQDQVKAAGAIVGNNNRRPKVDISGAVACGSVAASFALEQIGLPRHTPSGASETWNGSSVGSRLEQYASR